MIIDGSVVERSHLFQLRNVLDEPIQIRTIKSSCGCSAASWPRQPIAPGGIAEIQGTLRISTRGVREARLSVLTNTDRIVELDLRATGRQPTRVYAAPEVVDLVRHTEAELLLVSFSEAPAPPPQEPEITNTGTLETQVGEWKPIAPGVDCPRALDPSTPSPYTPPPWCVVTESVHDNRGAVPAASDLRVEVPPR